MKAACAFTLVLALSIATGAVAAVEPSSWPPTAGQAAAPTSDARLYVLTFTDVDIATAAEDVLGATLGLPYTIEPGVTGRVTFKVEERLTPEQLLDRFVAALDASGLALRGTATQVVISTKAAVSPSTPAAKAVVPASKGSSGFAPVLALLAACAALGALGATWATWRGRKAQTSPEREAVLSYLVESGAATRKQVARARLVARREGGPPEHVLDRAGDLPQGALVEAYCAAGGFAAWRPGKWAPMTPQPSPLDADPPAAILALHDDGELLTVVTDDPLDDAALSRVVFATGRNIRILVASPADLAASRAAVSA